MEATAGACAAGDPELTSRALVSPTAKWAGASQPGRDAVQSPRATPGVQGARLRAVLHRALRKGRRSHMLEASAGPSVRLSLFGPGPRSILPNSRVRGLRSPRGRAERGLTTGSGRSRRDGLCGLLGPRPLHLRAAPQNLRAGRARTTGPPGRRGCPSPPCSCVCKMGTALETLERREGRRRGRAVRPSVQLRPGGRLSARLPPAVAGLGVRARTVSGASAASLGHSGPFVLGEGREGGAQWASQPPAGSLSLKLSRGGGRPRLCLTALLTLDGELRPCSALRARRPPGCTLNTLRRSAFAPTRWGRKGSRPGPTRVGSAP